MDRFSFLNTVHAQEIDDLYHQYLKNPDSLEPSWRAFFQGFDFGSVNYASEAEREESQQSSISENSTKEFKVIELINAYRIRGHLFTKTNPVRARRTYTPTLDHKNFGLLDSDLDTVFEAGEQIGTGKASLRAIINHLKTVYCDAIGVEYMHIRNPVEVKWFQQKLNINANHTTYELDEKKYLLKKLIQAVGFEGFLQKKYVGQKRFSLEGGETLIPAMSAAIRLAAQTYDCKELVLGMAHRGRLNTLANIFRKPAAELFNEFEGKDFEDKNIEGDVKYHMGATVSKELKDHKKIKMNLVPNPSHLEAVGPIVQGIARAKIDKDYQGDSSQVLPIIVHGDAAIAGQGVVYEVIQMSKLRGYSTGGTIHIVVNNQIGFTTNYLDGRSSTYCTDIAKITLSPVMHVNADDVEAVVHAMQIALDFRMKFKRDIFIDLLGYRKHGHNEGDEPRFTQPNLYKAIAVHPNPRDVYAKKLIEEGVISQEYFESLTSEYKDFLEEEFTKAKKQKEARVVPFMSDVWEAFPRKKQEDMLLPCNTQIDEATLKEISKTITTVPPGVQFLRKAEKILNDRKNMVFETNKIDWGMAESLAYASLLAEGFDVRISGQDVERGTFSHRHAIFRDEQSEERICLLNMLSKQQGHFQIYNSLLSEYGVLGFDYGYAYAHPNSLTVWEAQFGDFSNGAQIVFDQYLSSSEVKWKLQNGLVVLLPHGYEGQGSEHSSARVERFLQLCAVENMIVANCTTPANFFHLLRRQLKRDFRKPLIVFTPKSLLRHPDVVSSIEDLATGTFEEIKDDQVKNQSKIKKVVFCSGKFYYELIQERTKLKRTDIAIVRIEQLFPLHLEKIEKIISRYSKADRYVWAQEEPENMGAWSFILQRLRMINLELVARPLVAVPAAGSVKRFKERQQAVIDKVFQD